MGRYGNVIVAFGHEFLAMASGLYHPILPLAVLAAALRFDPQQRREVAYSGSILGALLAGYAGVYFVTANASPGSCRLPWAVCWYRRGRC